MSDKKKPSDNERWAPCKERTDRGTGEGRYVPRNPPPPEPKNPKR